MASMIPPNQLQRVLADYAFSEWPDLSAHRSPLHCAHITSSQLAPIDVAKEPSRNSFIILAIARIIGAYCGTNDLLLGVQTTRDGVIGLLRVAWNDEQRWETLFLTLTNSLSDAPNYPVSVSQVRNTLSLGDNQYPCLALCSFGQCALQSNSDYPATFSYDSSTRILKLSASIAVLHSTVSSQIMAQVQRLLDWAPHHASSFFANLPSFPSDVMSISERATDEEVALAYPHLPPVSFAPDYLALRAKDMPNSTAVRWYPELSLESPKQNYESISYLDLHRKANQVARWLLRNGLQPEGRVAVCLDRDLKFHIIMMGVMRAGGCYVPIDPELPLERKTYIAKNADATFVLTSSQIVAPDVFGTSTRYIEHSSTQLEISQENHSDLDYMKPGGLAYLLYTSGTTGNPKGCLLTHRGLAQAILALSSTAAEVQMENIHDGRYLAVASIAFDVHLAETIVPVALGMPLLTARRSQLLENLPVYVNKLGVTHLGIVPSLIEATLNASQTEKDVTLRYIASGGEKMSDSILDKWANHPLVRLANFYGPSEVTIGCCARYMTSATPRANIGRTFANVSAYVVDADMNILLRGSIGELVVEGPLVGRGYQGRPDLTEKVFMEWPRKGCWAYRTGDVVRMMPDSTIEIVGRIDTQIKLRGVRIESEGISAIVRNAVPPSDDFSLDVTTVLAKHPSINIDQLVSLFSWDKKTPISTRRSRKPHIVNPPAGLLKQIKSKCESELPRYMRPAHLIPLSWLPLSSNGKTDAKILTQIFKALELDVLASIVTSEDKSQSRPCTDMERKVFNILQKHVAMPFDEPHAELNVFECGLDSMAVIRFATELKVAFNTKISASEIMKSPWLSGIALRLLTSLTANQAKSSTLPDSHGLYKNFELPYDRHQVQIILPPFPVQEGVLARSTASNTLYVQHIILSIDVRTSLPNLKLAWKRVVDRHSILRTIFHFGRTLSQIVLHRDVCALNWTDNHELLLEDCKFGENFFKNRAPKIAQEINQNLSVTPPYCLSVYKGKSETFLVLSIHHALFDGVSLPRLFWEVEQEYQDKYCGNPPSSSEILSHILAIKLDEAKLFWKKYFLGFSGTQQPLVPTLPLKTQRDVVHFKSSLSSLRALAASQHITLQALLTSAFALLLARHIYKQRDVVFGVIRSGRLLSIENIDDAICPLVSVVPTRVNFGASDISLETIQQGISSIVEYEHLSLGKVQMWVSPGKQLFDILFSLSVDNRPKNGLWSIVESEPPEPDYPLAVEVVLNPTSDSLLAQAAWLDQAQNSGILVCIDELEDVVQALAVNPTSYILQSLANIPAVFEDDTNPPNETLIEDGHIDIDPELHEKLRSIIAEFLEIAPRILTPSTSFISMGLDSIKSVGLAKIITTQGHTLTSMDILRNATLRQLTTFLSCNFNSNDWPSPKKFDLDEGVVTEIRSQNIELADTDFVDLFPTTALQTGMLSQTINSGGKLYLHSFPMRISGYLDADRLYAAWNTAVRTFSILRTSFHFSTEFGVWVQAIHSKVSLDWAEVSVNSIEEYDKSQQEFIQSIKLVDETSFKQPPLWIRLFHLGTNDSTLVFVTHHALYDGNSIGLLIRAVEAFYEGLPFTCRTQFHELLPNILAQQLEGTSFWENKLRSMTPVRFYRDPSSASFSVTIERHIPLDNDRVKETLSQACVTMQCVGQAVWAMALSKHTGSADIVFGHTVSGRSLPRAEDVIGPVLNTIPFCIRLERGMDKMHLLRKIHQLNIDALPYQQASLRAIQKALAVDRIWDSLFLFQSPTGQSRELKQSLWTFDEKSAGREAKMQYPLNVEMSHCNTGIVIKCASLSDYVDHNGLSVIANDLEGLFLDILNDAHAPISGDFEFLEENVVQLNISRDEPDEHRSDALESSAIIPNSYLTSIYEPILMSVTNASPSLLRPETPLVTLGIDSITAIQIVGKFRQAGMVITANDIIRSITVGEMLMKVSAADVSKNHEHEAKAGYEVGELEKAAIYQDLNISPPNIQSIKAASSGMQWLIGAWCESKRTRFQHVFPFQLSADIDKTRLKAAWFSLVSYHPILRSTFACASGYDEPRIVIFSESSLDTWTEEFVTENMFYQSLLARMKNMIANPISTSHHQARALFIYSRNSSYLILHLHHFQYDAWSLPLLLHDLSALYTGATTTSSNDINSFLDYYAPNDRHHLEEQQKYWRNSFPRNFEPTFFPALRTNNSIWRPTERLIRTNACCIRGAAQLEERARSANISLQSVFLASWARMQAQVSKASSSTFGLWHSGRTGGLPNIENLAIPCMNVLPMHVSDVNQQEILEVAASIMRDLQRRTSVIEQSSQLLVNDWIGIGNNPICNTFVNIIKIAPNVNSSDQILKPAIAPYYVPDKVSGVERLLGTKLRITELIKDDLFVDIATIGHTDSIMMSIDAAAYLMDEAQADSLMSRWSVDVRGALGIAD
ncbi:peptide synthetase [Pholiota conissans]|uniref:Peptide synthetase n=1 Tax=Pholiota conissans TaxID=109636 RepID=A0A9P5Z8T2_9AGAR|nr:peptide synthetase [Pholiota conissans]